MPTLIDAFPLIKSLRDAVFLSATIGEIEPLTPRLRRIRFDGPRLRGLNWTPGQHIRLQVAGLGESFLRLHPNDALRTYSIYNADPDLGTLDIVMFDHGGDPDTVTPARRWSNAVAVGDDVQFTRPQGNLVIRDDARYHVFAGDETASVAFAAMLRSLPTTDQCTGWSRQRLALITFGWPAQSSRWSAGTPRPRTPLCSPMPCARCHCLNIPASPTSRVKPAAFKRCERY